MIDRTPIMTSNSLPSPYAVSASSSYGLGYEAYRAFDKSGNVWATNSTQTGWIVFDFGSKKWAVNGYSMLDANPYRAPLDWTFEGSDDGVSWTVLHTVVNKPWDSGGVKRVYSFPNSVPYRKYRMNITANNTDAILEIQEIEIYAPDLGGGALFGVM